MNDPRPPVLYLRSFQDDSATEQTAQDTILKLLPNVFNNATTEGEQLTAVLQKIGPVISIGDPNKKLPNLGPVNKYVSDDQWKAAIIELMQRASLVVLRIGMTEGLWWEVQSAKQWVAPERILLVVPWHGDTYAAFRARFAQELRHDLPELPAVEMKQSSGRNRHPSKQVASIQGFIYFDSDRTPHYLALVGSSSGLGKPLIPVFQQTLQPVLVRYVDQPQGAPAKLRDMPRTPYPVVTIIVMLAVSFCIYLLRLLK